MLRRTFLHLPGIGSVTEQRLWQDGVIDWPTFLDRPRLPGISPARRDSLCRIVESGLERLDDLALWCRVLPPGEHWRLFRRFRATAGYLDIETSGRTVEQGGEITLIGIHHGGRFIPYVNGYNLEAVESALDRLGLVVTFNGACFDLPYMRAYFRHLRLPPGHIDLRQPLKRLGYTGGLKKIEPLFGLDRGDDIDGLDGWQAVLLWRKYRRGDRSALGRLIKYNRADTVNLEKIMETVYHRLSLELVGPAALENDEAAGV